jgi:CubicO group peptidase (beta-lactamase class C family)
LAQRPPTQTLAPPAVDATMGGGEIAAAMDAWLGDLNRQGLFNGVVLVARDGREVYVGAHGAAALAPSTPLTEDTRFGLASIGKIFTHTAVLQLIQDGRLTLETTIADVLPDYPQAISRTATVEQLLRHRGGIADQFGPAFMNAPKESFTSNHAYYSFVSNQPAQFAPGERNEYCNGCYIVLGEIIERISGVPYEQYVADHILAPAGMSRAGFFRHDQPPADTAQFLGQPQGPASPLQNVDHWHGVSGSGAGNIYASARDLLAFDNALRELRLLNAANTGRMFGGPPVTTERASAGLGIAGGAPGVNTVLESDGVWTLIVLTNRDAPVAESVAETVFPLLTGGEAQ